jgi:arylsulfatase A-like enzyme
VETPVRALLIAFAGLLASCGSAAAPRKSPPPPNIVVIISDDHGWTDYGFMGHAEVKTPNLDRLASQSLTYRRGYVPTSLCCPSLASIISGRYPHQHKVTSNDPPLPEGAKPGDPARDAAFAEGRERMNRQMDAVATLPRLLAARGYISLQTGKWWQGDYTRGGFTHGMTKGSRHGDDGLKIGRQTMQPIQDFLAAARGDEAHPFFLWYAPMLPHEPHNAPARILDKYKDRAPSLPVAKYWANIDWFDETCGQLLDLLDRQGVSENTIVVYVTDNGWIQKPEAGGYAPKSKQSPYDGGLRTPIMIRWPGHVIPRLREDLASSLDIAPTLLAAVGVEPPPGLPGLNLLDDAAVLGRTALFGECFTHNAVDLDNPAASLRWRWVIEGSWKLIAPSPKNEKAARAELYDLAKDPHETADLASAHADRVQALTRLLDKWWNPTP